MGLGVSSMFAEGIKGLTTGLIDWDTHVIKAHLMKFSYDDVTFTESARDTHVDLADVPANDRMGDSTTISSPNATIIAANDDVVFGSNITDITFPAVTAGTTIGGIVVFVSSATEGASQLICYNRFTTSVKTDDTDVKVTLNASGFFKASYDGT
jgi:hypothetical protein